MFLIDIKEIMYSYRYKVSPSQSSPVDKLTDSKGDRKRTEKELNQR